MMLRLFILHVIACTITYVHASKRTIAARTPTPNVGEDAPTTPSDVEDAQSVRDNPTYNEHGIRFCSIDRPGYGWSEGYFNNNPDNFNDVAKLTLQVLQKEEITGDLILNFHSLGAYHALALSAEILKLNQKETEKSTKLWKIRGMVAVDAMVPEWYNYDKKRETTHCSTTAPLTDGNDTGFWKLIRTVVPSGGPRLLYATGFMGFSDQVNLYPKQYIKNARINRSRITSIRMTFFHLVCFVGKKKK